MTAGMGSHQSARAIKDEWLTPPHILSALGKFDLDPCASVARPWGTAAVHYTREDNGLTKPWLGRVWCNPPYGREQGGAELGGAVGADRVRGEQRGCSAKLRPAWALCASSTGGATEVYQ